MTEAHDCITKSKSISVDVRILKVAEWLATVRRSMLSQNGYSWRTSTVGEAAAILQDIAAEIRAAATLPRAITLEAILASFAEARTERDLADAWRDAVPSLPTLTTAERQTITETWITRLCVVSEDDGR